MSDDRYIKMLEAYECEGYSYSKASKLAYEQFTGNSQERIFSEEEEEKMLAELEEKKKGIKTNE
jgi:hypothetical protein